MKKQCIGQECLDLLADLNGAELVHSFYELPIKINDNHVLVDEQVIDLLDSEEKILLVWHESQSQKQLQRTYELRK